MVQETRVENDATTPQTFAIARIISVLAVAGHVGYCPAAGVVAFRLRRFEMSQNVYRDVRNVDIFPVDSLTDDTLAKVVEASCMPHSSFEVLPAGLTPAGDM